MGVSEVEAEATSVRSDCQGVYTRRGRTSIDGLWDALQRVRSHRRGEAAFLDTDSIRMDVSTRQSTHNKNQRSWVYITLHPRLLANDTTSPPPLPFLSLLCHATCQTPDREPTNIPLPRSTFQIDRPALLPPALAFLLPNVPVSLASPSPAPASSNLLCTSAPPL